MGRRGSRALVPWSLGAALLWTSACAPQAAPPVDTAPPSPAVGPPPAPSGPVATETEYLGWKYFQVYCARCHGEDALGSLAGPDLTFAVSHEGGVTRDSFALVVRDGTASKEMKGFAGLLDDSLIGAIFAYVEARSQGRLGRGRPARAPT